MSLFKITIKIFSSK